jgi:uncharacterized integral membrane protein
LIGKLQEVEREPSRAMSKLKLVAIAGIALIVVIAVLQNTQTVETELLFLTVALPNAALLFGTLIVGFAIGVLTSWSYRFNRKTAAARSRSWKSGEVVEIGLRTYFERKTNV